MDHAQIIRFASAGLHLTLQVTSEGDVWFTHCAALPDPESVPDQARSWCRLVEVQCSGHGSAGNHGRLLRASLPGRELRYVGHHEELTRLGRKLVVALAKGDLLVECHLQALEGVTALRTWTEVVNRGPREEVLEAVSSFCLGWLTPGPGGSAFERLTVHIPHNHWYAEAQWTSSTLAEAGFAPSKAYGQKRLGADNQGTWSTSMHLPLVAIEDRGAQHTWAIQIEHHGGWSWAIQDLQMCGPHFGVVACGPTARESHWSKRLAPGERFVTATAGVACAIGGADDALRVLTTYRRRIRRIHPDHRHAPVIFNDYMNCLWGDPTEEKLIPLIAAAGKAGCEYYMIDAGWYGDGDWWTSVGAWVPSTKRFPSGLKATCDRIRAAGMIPGLWLEIEVMGVNCPLGATVGDDWFWIRNGRRVVDHGRWQLDFRNPAVRAHADAVVDRLVNEYGAGYIKMDYNIDAGPGTERDADSWGDGCLEHQRAYAHWLDNVFDRHPTLVIENCSSGGLRMDYALNARHQLQSTSDQTDYRLTAGIAAGVLGGLTPEQAGTWAYPLKDQDADAVAFNMVNAMLMRIFLSGQIHELAPERLALVHEALTTYRTYRHRLHTALPVWPWGFGRMGDPWLCLGLDHPEGLLLAVWHVDGDEPSRTIPLPALVGGKRKATVRYPQQAGGTVAWDDAQGLLTVTLPTAGSARLIELTPG
jgi:alpha-galactosidase